MARREVGRLGWRGGRWVGWEGGEASSDGEGRAGRLGWRGGRWVGWEGEEGGG